MVAISRSDDVRLSNQRIVLAALRSRNPISRTELRTDTGLSAATVTAITGDLLENGYLVEAEQVGNSDGSNGSTSVSKRGRPQVSLALNPKAANVAVLILTLNRISAAVADYSGKLLFESSSSIDTQKLDRSEIVRCLVQILETAIDNSGVAKRALRQITVAVQGVSDAKGTKIQWSPIISHRDLEIANLLEQRFQASVKVTNDATMIAAALRELEPERFGHSFAAILLAHGIGMGLYLKGQPFSGIWSSAAEFGHMCFVPNGALCRCGRHGCIEAYAGDYGIWRAATGSDPKQMPTRNLDASAMIELATRAKQGDERASKAYQDAGAALGHGLRNLFALLDPFPVAFVGSGAIAFDLMEPMIRRSLGLRNIGLSHSDTELYSRTDDLYLTQKGALVTALADCDKAVQSFREPAILEHANVG